MKVYCIDIDGTLFDSNCPDYHIVNVRSEVIKKVNDLYNAGNYIKLFTARGSGTERDWADHTHEQLLKYGVKFHELRFGKPMADYYVDDRNMSIEEFLKCT